MGPDHFMSLLDSLEFRVESLEFRVERSFGLENNLHIIYIKKNVKESYRKKN